MEESKKRKEERFKERNKGLSLGKIKDQIT